MRVWKLLPSWVLLAASVAAVGAAQTRDARVKDGVVVRQGKEIKIKDSDLTVGFVSVADDSRCPEGATCVWAGNARVHLLARNSKGECAEFDLNTNAAPMEREFGGYKITLEHLAPAPSIHHGLPKPEDYEATIVVSKIKKK